MFLIAFKLKTPDFLIILTVEIAQGRFFLEGIDLEKIALWSLSLKEKFPYRVLSLRKNSLNEIPLRENSIRETRLRENSLKEIRQRQYFLREISLVKISLKEIILREFSL